jgi:hypothetical protein
MAGYSGTPLWKKLGYTDGLEAHIESAYRGYVKDLQLPRHIRVTWAKQPRPGIRFVHLFVTTKNGLTTKLRSVKSLLAPNGVIWVSWPKKTSGVVTDLSEDAVRSIALPLGLVDIKVCAVNEIWSALKLMIRKELR